MSRLLTPGFILGLSLILLSACGGGGDSGTPVATPANEPTPTTPPPASTKDNYTLYIQQDLLTITKSPDTNNGATTLEVWGFSDTETSSTENKIIPGTTIYAEEGKTVTVSVKNNLNTIHDFNFVTLPTDEITSSTNKPIEVSETITFTITPKKSGIYLYEDSLNNGVNRSLGLFGVMIVRPATELGNLVWPGGPGFNKEVLWVISDMDYPNWNQVAINNGADKVDTTKYKANYFLMNGMNGFQAMSDDLNTNITGNVGETILVRIANAGQYSQSLHFHGSHFQVISRNGNRLNEFVYQDTINMKPKETAMVLYTIDQVGHYPMHVHTAQLETGKGVYLNGTAAMIIGK